MRIDHDFHIHTKLSSCANESATLDNYLNNAKQYGLKKIGFSDHLWDSAIDGARKWYHRQNFEHVIKLKEQIAQARTSCKSNNSDASHVSMYFGCETEYDYLHRGIALTEAVAEQFDFILVSNSHTQLTMPKSLYEPYQKHADFMVQAYEDILNSPISRYVTAIAHPFHAVNCPYDYRLLYSLIPDRQYMQLFDKTAQKGIAVEISMAPFLLSNEDVAAMPQIRMLRLAKKCGCKFVFGSDAHSDQVHKFYYRTESIAALLELKDTDLLDLVK